MYLFKSILVFCIFVGVSFAANCGVTSVGFTPIMDMTVEETYQGYSGTLYRGSNVPPPLHMAAAMTMASQVFPRDVNGNSDPNGKIGFTSIGMSNTNQEFSKLMEYAAGDPLKKSTVVLMNGAQGGQPAEKMVDINAAFWTTNIPNKLSGAGLTAQQVQVAWFKQTNAGPTGPFPNWADNLKMEFVDIMQNLYTTFPNIKLVYFAPRIYAGYASSTLNPEPYAYEQGFSCKWTIDLQVDGDLTLNYNASQGPVKSALLLWGPYLWADGMTPNSDGTFWVCPTDYKDDGTHPSNPEGRIKVADLLFDFVHNDETCFWYRGEAATNPPPATTDYSGSPCYNYNGKPACLADCNCGGCQGGGGCRPGNAAGPFDGDGTCSGTWHYGEQCGQQTTDSPPPPPPPPTTEDLPACSTFNGNPPGCQGACYCGHCPGVGCTEFDPQDPGTAPSGCTGTWQYWAC